MSPSDTRSAAVGLLFTPLVVGIAALVLPRVELSSSAADFVVFTGATTTAVVALGIAARGYPRLYVRLTTVAVAALLLAVLAWRGATGRALPIVVDAALVAAAWGIGTSIGRRIEHPGHLLPACVVVASADAASVVSSFGPSHAIAESERALSVVAIAFPVPGTTSFAPALGVGDLVFVALVLGAMAAHDLSITRGALLAWAGAMLAGLGSALLAVPIPALVPIAAAMVVGVPEARRVRAREKRVAAVAMVIAVSVAAATIGSQLPH
ncbi:MAG: hypothetical protein ABW133_22640 [Polyangiaceae bacterium]